MHRGRMRAAYDLVLFQMAPQMKPGTNLARLNPYRRRSARRRFDTAGLALWTAELKAERGEK